MSNTYKKHYKKIILKSLLLVSIIGITGCQPSDRPTENNTEKQVINDQIISESPIVINEDTVTMSPAHILSIKPSRYQPSLGLQGNIEAIEQARFKAKQALTVQQVLVELNQRVDAGTPLFLVERQNTVVETNHNSKVSSELKVDAAPFITIRAPFAGRVDELTIQAGQQVATDTLMLSLSNDNDLHFVATLPIQAKPQLSVGQTVNFTTSGLPDKFTGQVSKLTVNNTTDKLLVDVHVIDTETSLGKLRLNMAVSGRVDYGQIEVGTIVPKSAIHDADLSALSKAPFRPIMTLTANVWIIQQDQRLTRQPVEVIEYDPDTDRYLIAGINNDSLICLAQLPLQSAGKKVIVS